MPKQAQAKRDGRIHPQNNAFNQFLTRKMLMLSKRYESTEIDRRTWPYVPSGTLWSTNAFTISSYLIRINTLVIKHVSNLIWFHVFMQTSEYRSRYYLHWYMYKKCRFCLTVSFKHPNNKEFVTCFVTRVLRI